MTQYLSWHYLSWHWTMYINVVIVVRALTALVVVKTRTASSRAPAIAGSAERGYSAYCLALG